MHNLVPSAFFDRSTSIAFDKLCEVAHIAALYGVEHIIKEAVSRLEVVFPISWQASRILRDSYYVTSQGLPEPPVKREMDDCLAAVKLARAINSASPPAFIVMAFYFSCQLQLSDIAENVSDDPKHHATISRDDFKTCLGAVEKLLRANTRVKGTWFEIIKTLKCGLESCQRAKDALVCQWGEDGRFASTAALDPCPFIEEAIGTRRGENSLCATCTDALRTTYDARRAAVFNGLGKTFDIQSWPVGA